MPFGLTNALASMQELVNDTLREFLDVFVVAYLDDIIVYTTSTLEEHVQHVKQVFSKLESRNLKVSIDKCEFYKKEVKFLRFIIGVNGVRIDLEKVHSINY